MMSAVITTPSGQPGPMKPGDYTPAAQPRIVTWQMKRLEPPSPLYVTVDDVLRVAAATSQTNEVVTVSYRLLRAMDGQIVIGQDTIAPANDRSIATQDIPLAEGFLLSVSLKAAVATTRGQTFCRLFLNPKALGQGQPGLMMMADYVTTRMAPGYPNGRSLAPSEGPGWVHLVQNTSIPAGTDAAIQAPANTRYFIKSGSVVLQTSVAAGNRDVSIDVTTGGILTFIGWPELHIPASTTSTITLSPSRNSPINTPGNVWLPIIPDLILQSGDAIETVTAGLAAGDQFTVMRLAVEEWLDNI